MKRSILTGERRIIPRSGIPLLAPVASNPASNDDVPSEQGAATVESMEATDNTPLIVSVVIIFASSLAWYALRRRFNDEIHANVHPNLKSMESDASKANLSVPRERSTPADAGGVPPAPDAGETDIRQYEQHLQAMIAARRIAAAASAAAALAGSPPVDPRFGAVPAAADPRHGVDPRLGALPAAPPPPPSTPPPPPQNPPPQAAPTESCHYI